MVFPDFIVHVARGLFCPCLKLNQKSHFIHRLSNVLKLVIDNIVANIYITIKIIGKRKKKSLTTMNIPINLRNKLDLRKTYSALHWMK